jgi:hypothetical protein
VSTHDTELKLSNSEMGDATSIAFCKESVEQTPSMIGSTSIEIPNISQNEVQTQVIVEQTTTTTTTEKVESQTSDLKQTGSTEQELPTISVEVDTNLPNLEFNKTEETSIYIRTTTCLLFFHFCCLYFLWLYWYILYWICRSYSICIYHIC